MKTIAVFKWIVLFVLALSNPLYAYQSASGEFGSLFNQMKSETSRKFAVVFEGNYSLRESNGIDKDVSRGFFKYNYQLLGADGATVIALCDRPNKSGGTIILDRERFNGLSVGEKKFAILHLFLVCASNRKTKNLNDLAGTNYNGIPVSASNSAILGFYNKFKTQMDQKLIHYVLEASNNPRSELVVNSSHVIVDGEPFCLLSGFQSCMADGGFNSSTLKVTQSYNWKVRAGF